MVPNSEWSRQLTRVQNWEVTRDYTLHNHSGVHRDKESLPNSKVQKPYWYTSARVHDATAQFPQILVRGLELKGECDESASTIFHRKCGQDARFSSGHTSVSCVLRLNVATWQPIVVNLAIKRRSSRCVCRLNAAQTWTQERKSSSPCR